MAGSFTTKGDKLTDETKAKLRAASAKRWARFYEPHPCGSCDTILKKKSRKYCSWACELAGRVGRPRKKITLTKEHRLAVSRSLIGNQRRKGIPHSDEVKAEMSMRRSGVAKSLEHRAHMSETSKKMGALGLKSTMKGRHLSDASKLILSQKRLAGIKSGRIKLRPCRKFATPFTDRFGRQFVMRSSWEKRIAIELDTLLLNWAYEPDVLHLPNGTNYLPDFWVNEFNGYLEVKGWPLEGLAKVALAQSKGHRIEVIRNPKTWLMESEFLKEYGERNQISA
jgi:hypothetical protein